MIRQPLAHDAGDDVDGAAGGKADQPAHRPVRVVGGGGGDDRGKAADQAEQCRTDEADHCFSRHFVVSIAAMVSQNAGFAYDVGRATIACPASHAA